MLDYTLKINQLEDIAPGSFKKLIDKTKLYA